MKNKLERKLGIILPPNEKGSLREATKSGAGNHGGTNRQRHRRERRMTRETLRCFNTDMLE